MLVEERLHVRYLTAEYSRIGYLNRKNKSLHTLGFLTVFYLFRLVINLYFQYPFQATGSKYQSEYRHRIRQCVSDTNIRGYCAGNTFCRFLRRTQSRRVGYRSRKYSHHRIYRSSGKQKYKECYAHGDCNRQHGKQVQLYSALFECREKTGPYNHTDAKDEQHHTALFHERKHHRVYLHAEMTCEYS